MYESHTPESVSWCTVSSFADGRVGKGADTADAAGVTVRQPQRKRHSKSGSTRFRNRMKIPPCFSVYKLIH